MVVVVVVVVVLDVVVELVEVELVEVEVVLYKGVKRVVAVVVLSSKSASLSVELLPFVALPSIRSKYHTVTVTFASVVVVVVVVANGHHLDPYTFQG